MPIAPPAAKAELDISIVTYNSERWLEAFLDSLLAQDYPCEKISLLWRDNGSSDGSVALLRTLSEKHRQRFARFEIDAGENVGFGCGHNSNIDRLESDFFLVTNVDLEFETDTLDTLLCAATSDAADVAAWECRQKPYEHPKDYHPVSGATEWCSSACVLFRSAAFKEIGGYEPKLFLYGEDVEISYRLRDRGYRLRYVPQASVWHYTYEEAAEVKPSQFLGSTLANVLLRCRYGSRREVIVGFLMYFGLLLARPSFPQQRRRPLKNMLGLPRLAWGFLRTRRRSDIAFSFRLWDYSIARDGAFYSFARQPMAHSPLISVLVRTMPGRSGKLHEAVASIAAQTYPHIELVVVEDGGATAQDYMDQLRDSGRFANVAYRPLEKGGRCLAGNAALAMAQGKLMCFLDDDDLFYADHLEVLVGEWLREPQLGAVYGLAFQVRTKVLSEEPWQYQDIEHSLLYRQPFSRTLLWHHNFMPIQTVLFDRRLYDANGGFDPELDNLEDWNLWVRYSLHDNFRMIPKVTSLYRVPAVSTHASGRQKVLDDYYAIAQAKHATLRLEVSPPQVLAMANELSRELYVATVSASWLRRTVMSIPGFRWVYHPLRRAWHLFKRARA